jgi:hypothetical protein
MNAKERALNKTTSPTKRITLFSPDHIHHHEDRAPTHDNESTDKIKLVSNSFFCTMAPHDKLTKPSEKEPEPDW